jgi:hypothetical protein
VNLSQNANCSNLARLITRRSAVGVEILSTFQENGPANQLIAGPSDFAWAARDSNPRPPVCKTGALDQLS